MTLSNVIWFQIMTWSYSFGSKLVFVPSWQCWRACGNLGLPTCVTKSTLFRSQDRACDDAFSTSLGWYIWYMDWFCGLIYLIYGLLNIIMINDQRFWCKSKNWWKELWKNHLQDNHVNSSCDLWTFMNLYEAVWSYKMTICPAACSWGSTQRGRRTCEAMAADSAKSRGRPDSDCHSSATSWSKRKVGRKFSNSSDSDSEEAALPSSPSSPSSPSWSSWSSSLSSWSSQGNAWVDRVRVNSYLEKICVWFCQIRCKMDENSAANRRNFNPWKRGKHWEKTCFRKKMLEKYGNFKAQNHWKTQNTVSTVIHIG